MLISADTCGENLGDGSIGYRRKSPVDGAGGIGIPFIRNKSEAHDKSKGAVLVIDEIVSEVTRLDSAKGHGNSTGKANGKDSG